jgi:hypothetical protein
MAKVDSRSQQFTPQFLSSARGEAAAQERFDFARLFIEKLCQEFSGG